MTAGRRPHQVRSAAARLYGAGRPGTVARVAVVRVAVVLDRIDDAVVPFSARTLARFADQLGDRAGQRLCRWRERAESVVSPVDSDGERVALTGLRAVLRPEGLVVRGARVGIVGTVGLIVLSAVTATLQSPTTAQYAPLAPPLGGEIVTDGGGLVGGPAGGTRYGGGAPGTPGAAPAPPATLAPTTTVGPYPGDPAEDYAAAARGRLVDLATAAPQAELHAVVSLRDYHSPDELRTLVADFRLVRVFLRAPPDGVVVSGAVQDPVTDVDAVFAAASEQATRLSGSSDDDAVRRRAASDAERFDARCPCLFAVVVRAPAGRLMELAERAAVRVVDPAPPASSPATTAFEPLPPERR